MEINFAKIEKKWQKRWKEKKVFEVIENKNKKKFYVLEMYPYPSGSGLHMGHAFNYTIGDVFARFKRMQGFNVLYPMGYDSFGLPAENAAIKAGEHPKKYTERSIKNFINQQKSLGLSYDWKRTLASHSPDYYKWNQFWFLKFFEKGLAYRKKAPVNFCKKCDTVLANEQVHNGKCWRHEDTIVEMKHLEQWFLKTTDYADELLNDVDDLDWPERIKTMQKNWIGKSHGVEIKFEINGKSWPVFTTRPDTIFGVTFMVISAQHPLLMEVVTDSQKKEVKEFLKKIKTTKQEELDKLEKEGIFTGSYAVNPINGEKVPIWTGNFVVADYGSGMVMGVPAHDQRDFKFANKYNIPIKVVVEPKDYDIYERKNSKGNLEIPQAYTGEGFLVNSGDFTGLKSNEAMKKITRHLEKKNQGKKSVQFKMRDWLVSRQRYWGTPIPIVYCDHCGNNGPIPVSEKDLPVLLPKNVKFGKGNPLETNKDFVSVKCPKCGGVAKRETDTMDTFFDSSWYYLRYTDNKNSKIPFDRKKINYWMPVDQYIGGAEHATMHLIYARFFVKVLRDLGFLEINEPFKKLFNQGMLHGEDGYVMSKSRGNVVLPEEISKKYGIDTARFFLISIASLEKDIVWSDKGIEGSSRFIGKMINYITSFKPEKDTGFIEHKINKFVRDVTTNIEDLEYNIATIKIREMFSYIEKEGCSKKTLEMFLKVLHPFCPHISEELWERIGNKSFLSFEKWPGVDGEKINQRFDKEEEMVEKLKKDIAQIKKLTGKETEKTRIYVYILPNELEIYKKVQGVKVFAVNDKNKYDPENKSKKVRPGRPGIYLE